MRGFSVVERAAGPRQSPRLLRRCVPRKDWELSLSIFLLLTNAFRFLCVESVLVFAHRDFSQRRFKGSGEIFALRADRAVVVVTHDNRVFELGDRIARMDDGRIVEVKNNPNVNL